MEPAHLLGAGGAIGALLRQGVYLIIPNDSFPFATITVNAIGSFAIGLVAFSGVGESMTLFVAVGMCGAFTTYSTFSFETVELWSDGMQRQAIVNAIGNLVICLCTVGIAWLLF